jgi:hypothetical protein
VIFFGGHGIPLAMNRLFQTKLDGNAMAHASGAAALSSQDGIDQPGLETVLQSPILNADAASEEFTANLPKEVSALADIVRDRNAGRDSASQHWYALFCELMVHHCTI